MGLHAYNSDNAGRTSQPLESGRGVDIVLFGTRLIASGGFTTEPMEEGGGGGGRLQVRFMAT